MNIALIFAGGVGHRMNTKTIPKQFLELHGKPIIIYTLEQFDKHPEIDGIVVVCLETWISYLNKLLKKFGIEKVQAVVPGGYTGQASIRNGVYKINELYEKESIVLIHDGVRPLINSETISKNIQMVKEKGNSITVSPATETIAITIDEDNDDNEVGKIIPRVKCKIAKAPQCFILKNLYEAHYDAEQKGKEDYIDTACLMRDYGYKLYTVEGTPENIKITTPSDFYIFRAIMDARENSQIFG